jgi:hypothetical protein
MIMAQFQLFWRSNDDVTMSFIVDGGSQVLTPSLQLALTKFAWRYFVYRRDLLGDPWVYASVIYYELGTALSRILLCFVQ